MQKQSTNRGSKVLRIFPESNKQTTLINNLEHMLDMAKQGEIDNILMVCYNDDADVLTGYVNLTAPERMSLIGYLQTELVTSIVQAERG